MRSIGGGCQQQMEESQSFLLEQFLEGKGPGWSERGTSEGEAYIHWVLAESSTGTRSGSRGLRRSMGQGTRHLWSWRVAVRPGGDISCGCTLCASMYVCVCLRNFILPGLDSFLEEWSWGW